MFWSFCSKFVLSVSSLLSPLLPPLCLHITPWSQRAEGCIFSFRRATSSREPAAPGWWSSCPGCDDSSSSWSSSGSVTGCCCWGSPVGGEAGPSGMNGGCRRLLLVMKCPWTKRPKGNTDLEDLGDISKASKKVLKEMFLSHAQKILISFTLPSP